MFSKCVTTIPKGSRVQAIGTRNAGDLVRQDREIVCSAWQHAADQIILIGQGGSVLCRTSKSADAPIGVPYNIASYGLLLEMIAKMTGYRARYFIHTFGDIHIYENQIKQVEEQLSRKPLELPELKLADKENIDSWNMKDIWIDKYRHHPAISIPVAV